MPVPAPPQRLGHGSAPTGWPRRASPLGVPRWDQEPVVVVLAFASGARFALTVANWRRVASSSCSQTWRVRQAVATIGDAMAGFGATTMSSPARPCRSATSAGDRAELYWISTFPWASSPTWTGRLRGSAGVEPTEAPTTKDPELGGSVA